MQPFFAEPTGHPKAVLAPLEAHRNIEPVRVLARPEPSTEPTSHPQIVVAPMETPWNVAQAMALVRPAPAIGSADRPTTERRGANPGLQPAALTVSLREPATSATADPRPAAGPVPAPSRVAPDAAAQQNKTLAAQSSARPSSQQQPPAPRPPAQQNLPESKPVATPIAAHISVHYDRQGSTTAHADAEHLAAWLASSGFGAPQILVTSHAVRSSVVRYFFRQDAHAASLLVRELQKAGGNWRAEDCTKYKRKPPVGTIQLWPARVR